MAILDLGNINEDLKEFPKTSLMDGQQALVAGYWSANDGGGGHFYWNATSTTPQNGGTVFASDNGGAGRWHRVFSGDVNVRWFGAVGNGSVNDTAAIQAAIDYVYDQNLGTVYVPAGTYAVTTLRRNFTVNTKTVNITGAGRKATKFVKSGSGRDPIIQWSANPNVLEVNCTFRDFWIYGGARTFDGIQLTNVAYFNLDNVVIDFCARGIDNSGSLIWTGTNLHIQENNYGLITSAANNVSSNQIAIRDSVIDSNLTFGCDFGKGQHIKLLNCAMHSNGTPGNMSTGAVVVRDTSDDESDTCLFVVRDCWFESNNGWTMTIEGMKNSVISLDSNVFISPESGRACRIQGGMVATVKNCFGLSPGDTLAIASGVSHFTMLGGYFHTITDNAQNSVYHGSAQGASVSPRALNNFHRGASFTPRVIGTTFPGTGTYAAQYGSWGRNGNYVDFALTLGWTAHTGAGNLRVDLNNIPFTVANDTNNFPLQVVAEYLTFSGQLTARAIVNTKQIAIERVASGAALSPVALDTAGSLMISGRYRIADA